MLIIVNIKGFFIMKEVPKIGKSKSLTIYLLKNTAKSFKYYLKPKYWPRNSSDFKLTKHYIDKKNISGNIEKGMIFIVEESLSPPDWEGYLNSLSTKQIKLNSSSLNKAVLFVKLKGPIKTTFAITFGNGFTLLNTEFIVPDFGLTVSKNSLDSDEILSVDSTSIDRKIVHTKKQSVTFLMPEKILEYGTQNIIKNIYGKYKDQNSTGNFSMGGHDSLIFKGNIDLQKNLILRLNEFADLYSNGSNKLAISDNLTRVDVKTSEKLDNLLAKKILDIINSNSITKKQISPMKISPYSTFDMDEFNGFFMSGLGYKKSNISSDFQIDEVAFFTTLSVKLKHTQKNVEEIFKKINQITINRKSTIDDKLVPVCSVYKAINFETIYNRKKYIILSGKWYELDKEFYKQLKEDIDSIQTPNQNNCSVNFLNYKKKDHDIITAKGKTQASEETYNQDLAEKNHILFLDQKNYQLDKETKDKYGFKPKIPIELCDVLYFDHSKIQFVHVKRHSGAAGISHLAMQSLVSATTFINDNQKVVTHINNTIDTFNLQNSGYSFQKLNYKQQKNEIILAIIENKNNLTPSKTNSKLLTLLEMISLRSTIKNLEFLGFNCYLKFIPGEP